jgi:glycosyl transferase family 87
MPSTSSGPWRLVFRWLLPAVVFLVSFLVYLNGAFFSSYSALHIDLSINLVASRALRDGANPYGETVLHDRAVALGSPTLLVYQTLFTSYIQPPTSALSIVPYTYLSWRKATRAYLVMNNVFLLAAAALTVYIVRPAVAWPWAVAAAMTIVAFFSQIYGSFALGQVDATVCLLLAIGLLGLKLAKPPLTGAALAAAAAIKLIPAVLILYFLWRRKYAYAAWTVAIGALIFLVSVPLAGIDTYRSYFSHTLPGLLKGSTHYANISIAGAVARAFIHGPVAGLPPIQSLGELPEVAKARVVSALLSLLVLGGLALALGRSDHAVKGEPEQQYVLEYYLTVAAGLLISSVTWEFYVIWLLPLFIAASLAPARVLPGTPPGRLLLAGALLAAYIGLNYPGDYYLFDVNSIFYHPQWVPGVWVQDRIHLYHLDFYNPAVPKVRLVVLLFLFLSLSFGLLMSRRRPAEAAEALGTRAEATV